MIERINLIEKEQFRFTYKNLLFSFAGILLFCALLSTFQIGRRIFYKTKIEKAEKQLTFLKQEQDRLLRAVPQRLETGPGADLKNRFLQTPDWSGLIDDVSQRLPGTVWLTGLKGSIRKEPVEKIIPKKDKKPLEKKTEPARGLVVEGVAKNPSDLGTFVSQLKESPFLRGVVLSQSKNKPEGFAFTIECAIVTAQQ